MDFGCDQQLIQAPTAAAICAIVGAQEWHQGTKSRAGTELVPRMFHPAEGNHSFPERDSSSPME